MRRHGQGVYRDLKTTFAELVGLLGTQSQVARLALTRGEQTDLSRWSSTNDEHVTVTARFAPIDVIADLESAAGKPLVTRYLAQLQNCLLVPLPVGIADGAIAERTGRSAKEFGDVMIRIGDAVRDGRITPEEVPGILREIRDVMVELAALAEAVKAKAEEPEQ